MLSCWRRQLLACPPLRAGLVVVACPAGGQAYPVELVAVAALALALHPLRPRPPPHRCLDPPRGGRACPLPQLLGWAEGTPSGGSAARLAWGTPPDHAIQKRGERNQIRVRQPCLGPMNAPGLLLPISVILLAITQVPAALESMAVLDCQQRFMNVAKIGGELIPAIAVKFCNGTSEGREAF